MSLLDTASLVVTPNAYKEGKLYSVIPSDGSGDLSVTRATTATRVNSQGLVELVPYNLLSYSERFENAVWSKTATTVSADATTAPNGSTTADKLIPNTSTSGHWISQDSPLNAGSTYTQTIYAKADGYSVLQITGSTGLLLFYANFNLSNGTLGSSDGGTASIEDVGDGWYRISYSLLSGGAAAGRFLIAVVSSPTSTRLQAFTGDGTSGVYIWGAQLVEGTSALDYQMTETRLNIPRIDYSLGGCPSILVEPQRTNLALWSEQFDNASWAKLGATISADTTTSPSGILNADTLIETVTTNAHEIYRTPPYVSGTYTLSIYVKNAVGSRFLNISASNTGTNYVSVRFSPSTATLSSVVVAGSFSNGTASFETLGNEWYRVVLTYTCSTTFVPQIALSTDGSNSNVGPFGVQSYLGDGTSGLYIWGIQLEAGAYPTSYIPTTSASVTRNADVISKTGISSLIGQTEGTIFVDFDNLLQTTYGSEYLISLYGDASNQIWIRKESGTNTYTARVLASGSTAVTFLNIPVLNGQNKIALAYKSGQSVVYLNGALIATDTDAFTIGTSISQLGLANLNNTLVGYEKINSAALWKERLTDAQLAQLTTI